MPKSSEITTGSLIGESTNKIEARTANTDLICLVITFNFFQSHCAKEWAVI